ncbi:MAG: hypothetical protein GXY77_17360 [Fibrobacter sp.]|nr:hypothetical protein [Fibrobacter sp.]
MGFNPFKEKGVAIEKQIKPWSQLNTKPYDPESVHPYTRTRGILMNGIEVEAALFYHNWHRHTDNMDLRRQLAMVRRIEQQEQKMVNWVIPASETTIEVTIGYEQLAVDLTAAMAKKEPDPYVKAALDYALIEDFDHVYRYANLMLQNNPKKAEAIVKDLTEIMPGRPTVLEHQHPFDGVRSFVDRKKADPLTLMHIMTIIAAEQQTMNFYMNVGNRESDMNGRGLYQEIGMIEEQHVSHYGSLLDPRSSWFEMAALHEYNECYMYYSCMISEPDERIKGVWQQLLDNEIAHLHMIKELAMKHENKDIEEMFPGEVPSPLILESSKDYVRQIIETQFHYTADRSEMVPMKNSENFKRFKEYQNMVNGGEYNPSQEAVMMAVKNTGMDYRLQTEGEYPLEILKDRKNVPSRKDLMNYSMSR